MLSGILLNQCGISEKINATINHIVLPKLAVHVASWPEPGALADYIINTLWEIFSNVREVHLQLKDLDSSILIWAFPGELTGRPMSPNAQTANETHSTINCDQLSLLPALSSLLRCMALELNRPIILLSTSEVPGAKEVKDATAFLAEGFIFHGDYRISEHRLSSHEPRIVNEVKVPEDSFPLKGHILSLGGARGIVAEVLTRLTEPQSHLSLVGRTSLEPANPELMGLEKNELMRALMQQHQQSGEATQMSLKSLQKEAELIQSQRGLEQSLMTLRQVVTKLDYSRIDLTDPGEVKELLERESMSDITVLISGAGVIKDQSCLTKSRDSFETVLRTKVVPLCILLCHGLPPTLKTWLSFSSIASKSGNPGQADYAAGNEFLNTVVHWFSNRNPEIEIRTINWGPWNGSGMASPEVLQAFRSRGLEAIEPEAASAVLLQILHPEWNAVEVSAIALQPEVTNRLKHQQSLANRSAIWNYHSIPVKDSLATDEWRLLFHDSIPYLQGHRKNGRAVVPAALMLCLAADLAACLETTHKQALKLDLYVFNGITIGDSSTVTLQAKAQFSGEGTSGTLVLSQNQTQRPHYKISWQWAEIGGDITEWLFTPTKNTDSLQYCEYLDAYAACLFHSGVMARLCDRIIVDASSNTSWCRARPTPTKDQLGVDWHGTREQLPNRDLTLIDALLQLLLVQTIETYGVSALPQELSIVLIKPMPVEGEVQLTATIMNVQNSYIEARGACRDENGNLLFTMERSKFTISKELLDYPPGIIHSGEEQG